MTDEDRQPPHLSDAEIDAYWKGQLPEGDAERIEQHYLECEACRTRVSMVEDLITELRVSLPDTAKDAVALTYWRIAAGVLAAVALFAGWQWTRNAADLQDATARLERMERTPVVTSDLTASALPITIARLTPPTRDSGMPSVAPGGAGIVVFELDAREAGVGGTRFDVTLTGPTGQQMLQLFGLPSSAEGVVRVVVDGSLLAVGPHVFELRSGGMTVGLPFLIQP